jgi:hypothetical protein
MDNVQNCGSCITIPSSQTYRSDSIITCWGVLKKLCYGRNSNWLHDFCQRKTESDHRTKQTTLRYTHFISIFFCMLYVRTPNWNTGFQAAYFCQLVAVEHNLFARLANIIESEEKKQFRLCVYSNAWFTTFRTNVSAHFRLKFYLTNDPVIIIYIYIYI